MKPTTNDNISTYSFDAFAEYPEMLNIASSRLGGISQGSYSSLNIAFHVDDNENAVLENRKLLCKALSIDADTLTCGEQVHGAQVEAVTEKSAGKGSRSLQDAFTDTDSLITNVPKVPLLIQTADCAAVSLYDPVNHAIGIAHAGRKGTESEIVIKTTEEMHDIYGTCTENLVVSIGPCIYPCCYDMDLPSLIKAQLLESGVKPENIEESGICTSCNNDIFFSYRADGKKTGRFANIVMIQK